MYLRQDFVCIFTQNISRLASFSRAYDTMLFQLVKYFSRSRVPNRKLALQERCRCFVVLTYHTHCIVKEAVHSFSTAICSNSPSLYCYLLCCHFVCIMDFW